MTDRYTEAWRSLDLMDPMNVPEGEYFSEDERRYAAFRLSMRSRTVDVEDFRQLIALVELEPNSGDQQLMYRLLIQIGPTDALRELNSAQYRKFVDEEIALRSLDEPVSETELVELAKVPSKKVQLKVLGQEGITPSALEELVAHGITRAIRNDANNKLGRRGSASQ